MNTLSILIENNSIVKETLSKQDKLARLAKWLSVRLRTKCFWVRVHLQSLQKVSFAKMLECLFIN